MQNIKETKPSSDRRNHRDRTVLFCISLLLPLIFLPSPAGATQANPAWDSVNPAKGYRVFMRLSTGSYNYSAPAWQGTTTICRIDRLQPGQTYSFVARAFAAGDESGNSNEVSYTVPYQAPVANAGPDLAVKNAGTPVTLVPAPSSAEDSFFVAMNDGIYTYWNIHRYPVELGAFRCCTRTRSLPARTGGAHV